MEKKNSESPLPGNEKHAAMIIAYSIDEAKLIKQKCIELRFPPESVEVFAW